MYTDISDLKVGDHVRTTLFDSDGNIIPRRLNLYMHEVISLDNKPAIKWGGGPLCSLYEGTYTLLEDIASECKFEIVD